MPKGFLTHESRLRHFWDRVKKLRGPNACWVWTGCRLNTRQRYGALYLNYRKIPAHKFSFELHRRKVAPGEVVRHTCDNQACVRPDHLLAGSVADNVADRVARGRSRNVVGEDHGNAKLTKRLVRMIRRSSKSQRELARELGVSGSLVCMVRTRKLWSHVT